MRYLLVLAGDPPSRELFLRELARTDVHIAVDAGLSIFVQYGCRPTLIIGDLDSVNPAELEKIESPILRIEDQNTTDLEKAFLHLKTLDQPTVITILGALGNRSDHALNNLLVAARVDPHVLLKLITDNEIFIRVTPHCPFDSPVTLSTTLSMFPVIDCQGLTTTGLKWDIDNGQLGYETRISQSNVTTDPRPTVQVRKGILYIILNQ
jgi:thiamine pyrophosphokinase